MDYELEYSSLLPPAAMVMTSALPGHMLPRQSRLGWTLGWWLVSSCSISLVPQGPDLACSQQFSSQPYGNPRRASHHAAQLHTRWLETSPQGPQVGLPWLGHTSGIPCHNPTYTKCLPPRAQVSFTQSRIRGLGKQPCREQETGATATTPHQPVPTVPTDDFNKGSTQMTGYVPNQTSP